MRVMFGDLFFNQKTTVDLSKRSGIFASAMQRAREGLKRLYSGSATSLFVKSSLRLRFLGIFLAAIPVAGFNLINMSLRTGGSGVMTGERIYAIASLLFLAGIVAIVFVRMVLFTIKEKAMLIFFLPIVGTVVFFVGVPSTTYVFAAVCAFISTALCGFLTFHLAKKTDYYVEVLGRIRGFKNFIRTAEMDKLNLLFDEDPEYFYNILPYAWVFGLSDKWTEKFANLAKEPPVWYAGYYDNTGMGTAFNAIHLAHSLDRYEQRSAGKFISAAPPKFDFSSSGGGGGFSGGGGSFSGGGGSSGGGSGGGGGGSW
jgi:uncharacterized membrane protein YgcG